MKVLSKFGKHVALHVVWEDRGEIKMQIKCNGNERNKSRLSLYSHICHDGL